MFKKMYFKKHTTINWQNPYEEAKKALCKYIEQMNKCKLSAKLLIVEKAANNIFCQAYYDS